MTISEIEFQTIAEKSLRELDAYESSRLTLQGYSARLATPEVVIEVTYDGTRSFELNVCLGEAAQSDPQFELADILRVTECPASEVARVEVMQTGDLDALARLIASAILLLKSYGLPFLVGDSVAFARARAERSVRAQALTDMVRISSQREAADAAWAQRDFARVYALLNPISELLGERDARRLAIATERMPAS